MTAVAPLQPVILWDLDRTLVDILIDLTAIQRWKAELTAEFARFGLSPTLSPMLPAMENALDGLRCSDASAAEQLGHRVYELLDGWENADATGFRVHEQPVAMFVALASAGVPQAVVTNNGGPVVQRALKICLPGAVYANTVVVTRTFGRRAKPSREPLMEALALLGLLPGACDIVMVGDSSADELALQAAAPQVRSAVWVRAQEGRLWLGREQVADADALLATCELV